MICQFNRRRVDVADACDQRQTPAAAAGNVILWQTSAGVRCTSSRRDAGRAPFEITIAHGDKILTRLSFGRAADAAAFAHAALAESAQRPVPARPLCAYEW
ncbi:MAG TPA: hypothetical protein VN654_06910 [Vicinamibacterales bacterium]|nr:hypothetical protein [Vicinamibacterales bacterium]